MNAAYPSVYTTADLLNYTRNARTALCTPQKIWVHVNSWFSLRHTSSTILSKGHLQPLSFPLKMQLWPYLVNGHSVHIGVVHKPDDLVGEELPIVLRGKVGFCGLR